jgi:hypothetical protein
MMTRKEAMKALLTHAPDEIIVAVYSMAFELVSQRFKHPLNYTSVGAMGLASSHGLGLALGRPDRKIIVFDRGLKTIFAQPGPVFTSLKIVPRDQRTEAPTPADYPALCSAEARAAFREAVIQR